MSSANNVQVPTPWHCERCHKQLLHMTLPAWKFMFASGVFCTSFCANLVKVKKGMVLPVVYCQTHKVYYLGSFCPPCELLKGKKEGNHAATK